MICCLFPYLVHVNKRIKGNERIRGDPDPRLFRGLSLGFNSVPASAE